MNIAILYSSPLGSPNSPTLKANGLAPWFLFDSPNETLQHYFGFFDRLIFHETCPDNWLATLFLGRYNYSAKPCVPIDIDSVKMARNLAGLNKDQQEAIFDTCHKTITQVVGPPGTGKTITVAKSAFICMEAGERVVIATPSNIAGITDLDKLLDLFR